MAATHYSNLARLTLELQSQGQSSARALALALGISQPTLSRLLAQLGPEHLERFGSTRSARYALRRNVRNLGTAWPVHRLDETGRAHAAGELRAVHGGFSFQPANAVPPWFTRASSDGFFSGLPFFLQDIAPQGYLGRALASEAAPRLQLPPDPANWSDDDILRYLLADGDDMPGNLVLGDQALEAALRRIHRLPEQALAAAERAAAYPGLANAAEQGERRGSSAGGDQPKFLTTLRDSRGLTAVIVKFSSADSSPVSRRWADLLLCEHLAAEVLTAHGLQAARSIILDAGNRRFLEIERFDRTPAGGRRGLLTLGAFCDGLEAGHADDWIAAARSLETSRLLSLSDARELRWRACFGDLIANTDMHRGNTSVFLEDRSPLSLTPSYDTLPMFYAPGNQGVLRSDRWEARPPLPAVADVWPAAAAAAAEFWQRVASDERASAQFRTMAEGIGVHTASLRARFG